MSFFTSLLSTSPSPASASSNSSILEDIVIKSSSKECGKADSIGFSFSYTSILNSFNSGTGNGSSADSDSYEEEEKDDQGIISIGFDIVWDILSPTEPFIDLNTCKNFFTSILNNFLTNYI